MKEKEKEKEKDKEKSTQEIQLDPFIQQMELKYKKQLELVVKATN